MNRSCIIYVFFLFVLFLQSCTANKSRFGITELKTITLIDRNGITETINNSERIKQYQGVNFLRSQPYEKVLRIHRRTKEGRIPAYIHSYHENGQPKQYLEVIDSRAYGSYTEWHSNGNCRVRACVVGGEADLSEQAEKSWIFDGHSSAWDEEGCLVADIPYKNGVQEGTAHYYHKNGVVWRKVPFEKGTPHGEAEVYLDNGQLFQRISWNLGTLDGQAEKYWPLSTLAAEELYESNALVEGKYYDQAGKLICQIRDGNGCKALFGKCEVAEIHEFRNGNPEGAVKVFGTDKKLIRRYYVKNDQKHGEEIEYYELPHLRHLPKLFVTWHEGKIQGIAKTWYDNGVQESSREISNNAKNGVSTAWYRDGNLMLIEEYAHDKLQKGEYYRRGEKRPISKIENGNGTATLFDSEGNFNRKVYYENAEPVGTN